jgi:succinylglutamate desuccinylase
MIIYYFLVSVQIPPEGMKFIRAMLHALATVFEVGSFCWFGSEVMQKVTTLNH